ncbi:hypothetical protein E2C01_027893 [Portunus trituberculatus]|uniref:Uncharacterized protein n=1 Tax=Portunus trituberculatus TaxID=210409 RepID=A0A5B7EJB0_PORTR|nr:hypothetical protein [Portunus trituberculatus]
MTAKSSQFIYNMSKRRAFCSTLQIGPPFFFTLWLRHCSPHFATSPRQTFTTLRAKTATPLLAAQHGISQYLQVAHSHLQVFRFHTCLT